MPYRITKEYVWYGEISDEPGALAQKLSGLGEGGLNLELIVSRRAEPGKGLMFFSPLRTMEELEAAEQIGLSAKNCYHIIRVEGPNVAGLGAKIANTISSAGLSMREFTAAALGDQSVTNIAFDSDEDSNRAKDLLAQALAE